MNGAIEMTNKNIKKILQKKSYSYKDWHEKLPVVLDTYRTSILATSTWATLFSLVYCIEAVHPFN